MWTYLLIFFSVLLLLGIYLRKAYLLSKAPEIAAAKEKAVKQAREFADEEAESDEEKAARVGREEKQKASAFFEKGDSLLKLGKEEEAIKAFVQALALDPNHIETQHKLAMLYMQKEMFGAAAALFKSLSDLTEDPLHYSHLGLALYQQNEFEAARDAYQKAVLLDPSRPQRFVSLAMVYKALEETQLAIITLNKALEMEQENLDFLFLMANLQLETNNNLAAKDFVKTILRLDPENPEAKTLLKNIERKISEDASDGQK